MKKTITLIMAAFMLFMFIGCSKPKEQVDEEDMSRWIVEFDCDEESDLHNNRLEITVEELIKKWKSGEPLKISFQWYDEYIATVIDNPEFTLEPEVVLWYVNDEGERVKDGALNDDKYYAVMNTRYQIEDGKQELAANVLYPGLYQVEYRIMKNKDDSAAGPYVGHPLIVNYFVGNL